jgi:hypothetical protein
VRTGKHKEDEYNGRQRYMQTALIYFLLVVFMTGTALIGYHHGFITDPSTVQVSEIEVATQDS